MSGSLSLALSQIGICCIYLALGKLGLNVRPCRALRGITEQVHDDGALADRFVNVEEVCSRHPAILLCLFPASTVLSHADNHVHAIVAEVEALAVALGAVTNEGEGIVLEVLEELVARPIVAL